MSTMLKLGGFEIKWYSFFLLVAFSLGSLIIYKNRNKISLSKKQISDLLFNLVIIAIIGARLYYVIFNLDYYMEYPIDILKIWEGGLAIHGGIIVGLIYLIYFCKKKKLSIIKLTDLILQSHFQIKGIFSLFFASIFISILNAVIDHLFVDKLLKEVHK